VYFLLSNKESESYARCFYILKTECFKLNLCCSPESIFANFELSIHRGSLKVWPTITIIGCRFHLGQAWWRHIQNLGLSNDYRNQTEIGLF